MDAHRLLRPVVQLLGATAGLGVALLWWAPIDAQVVQEHSDRLDSLIALRSRIEAKLDSASRAMAVAGALDSAQVGRLRLYFAGQHRTIVEQGADSANKLLEAALGSEVGILDQLLIGAGFANDVVAAPERPDKITRRPYVSSDTPDAVQDGLIANIGFWINSVLDSAFTAWSSLSVPLVATAIDWEEQWVEFATAASPLVESCERGDEPECLVALGIFPVEDPILDWYDAEGRRELVRQLPRGLVRDPGAVGVCLARKWDQICIDLLKQQEAIRPPLSHRVRRGLLQYALAQSPGGFGRLLVAADSTDDVGNVLSAVARQELTTLLRDWRSRIAASRPDGVSVRWPTAAMTVLWIGVLVSLRLAASRRRRPAMPAVRAN